ncbi:MAG: hypothetical protein ACT4PG_05735 [Panacagrimonas sp.]
MLTLAPFLGFAAETRSATILRVVAILGLGFSTTHRISTAILGVVETGIPK